VKAELRKQLGVHEQGITSELDRFGLRGTLSPEQWKEFRRRGVPEIRIVDYLDAHGITPEFSSVLKEIGVDFESDEAWRQKGPGHYAAMADLVVTGRVEKIEYHVEGPYHTWVRVIPETVLKGKPVAPEVLVKQLYSGPHRSRTGAIVFWNYPVEPKFRLGERVLLFLRSWPRDLLKQHRVDRPRLESNGSPLVNQQYSTREMSEAELARGDYYEVIYGGLGAYKIVRGKAVMKSHFIGYPNPNEDEFALNPAIELIRRVAAVQEEVSQRDKRR
jgi:hypothetical protein